MNKFKNFTVLIADIITILIFISSSRELLIDYAKYHGLTNSINSPLYYFIIPAAILTGFLIVRIFRSIGILMSSRTDLMTFPFATALVTFLGAGFAISKISDIPHVSFLFISFSFILSKSIYGKNNYKTLRKILWIVLASIPTLLTIMSIPEIFHSQEAFGYFIWFVGITIVVLGAFGILVDAFIVQQIKKSSSNIIH